MGVMLRILASLLLVMAVVRVPPTISVRGEETVISNTARITAYWQTMLPNTPMPSAIFNLLTPTYGGGHEGKSGHIHASNTTANNEAKKVRHGHAATVEKVRHGYAPSAGKVRHWYAPSAENGRHGSAPTTENIGHGYAPTIEKVRHGYAPATEKVRHGYAPTVEKVTHGYAPTVKKDDQENFIAGHAEQNQDQNVRHGYARIVKNDGKMTKSNVHGDGRNGEGGKIHGVETFLEHSVMPGSTITPYIPPSLTSGTSLLPRYVADSIPVSTGNFTDVITMFSPASYAMADSIRSTLELCDNPPHVKGETVACVVSIESMVEFVSSVLGTTHHLRALSSPDVPPEGVNSGERYNVVELRRVTEVGETMTCHGLRFPVAMFICHAVNPTRAYSVTLEKECDDSDLGGPERIETLFVCHLNTSDFDPMKMPEQVKPGDAPLCHFFPRDNIFWAPSTAAVVA